MSCNCRNRCNRIRSSTRGACPCLQVGEFCSEACQCGHGRASCTNKPGAGGVLSEACGLAPDPAPVEAGDDRIVEEQEHLVILYEDESQEVLVPTVAAGDLDTSLQEALETSMLLGHEDQDAQAVLNVSRSEAPELPTAQQTSPVDISAVHKTIDDMSGEEAKDKLKQLVSAFAPCRALIREPDPPMPDDPAPSWCRCGRCRPMRLPEENVCCRRTNGPCLFQTQRAQLESKILDRTMLEHALIDRNDIFATRMGFQNVNLRFAAYRSFVLWRHGHLGPRRRVVIPSCIEWDIRSRFPEENELNYVGFKPAEHRLGVH